MGAVSAAQLRNLDGAGKIPCDLLRLQVEGGLSGFVGCDGGVPVCLPDREEQMSDETWVAEPIIGHRGWVLDIPKMELGSAMGPWVAGFKKAECLQPFSPHLSPSDDCNCGINVYKLWVPLSPSAFGGGCPCPMCSVWSTPHREVAPNVPVFGIIDLGGKINEFDEGYRAEYGRLAEATIIDRVPWGRRFTGYLEEKYEAPFRVMTYAEYREEWEATHGRDREEETDDPSTQAAPPFGSYHGSGLAGITIAGSRLTFPPGTFTISGSIDNRTRGDKIWRVLRPTLWAIYLGAMVTILALVISRIVG